MQTHSWKAWLFLLYLHGTTCKYHSRFDHMLGKHTQAKEKSKHCPQCPKLSNKLQSLLKLRTSDFLPSRCHSVDTCMRCVQTHMNCRVVYHLDRCIHWCHEGWKSQDQSSLACGALLVSSENPVDQAEISFQAHLRKAVQETSDPAHTKHEKYCNYTKCNNTSYIINSWCY